MKRLTTQTVPPGAVKRIFRFYSTTFLLRLCILPLLALFSQQAWAQATVTDVTFTQFDRYDLENKLLFQYSSLGQFSFSAVPDKRKTYYLNVFAKNKSGADAWIVQNLPVTSDETGTPITCQSMEVDYKLIDAVPGEQIKDITFSTQVTSKILKVKYTSHNGDNDVFNGTGVYTNNTINNTSARVRATQFSNAATAFTTNLSLSFSKKEVISGTLLNELSSEYRESTDIALFSNTTPVAVDTPVKDRDIPGDLDEGPNDCVPGSFARSIAWLAKKHGFGGGRSTKDIFDSLKAKMNACGLNFACQFKAKADYLKQITGGKGTTDSTWNPQSPADLIKSKPDCDIEIGMAPPPNGNIGHFITIVSISCGSNGCCTIKYRDDSAQGQPGGDKCIKTTTICGDSIKYNGTNRKILVIVVECVTSAARTADGRITTEENIQLLPNIPNPFDNTTMLRVQVKEYNNTGPAILTIRTDRGIELQKIKVNLQKGLNQVRYQHGPGVKGVLYCTLEVDGKVIGSQKMFVQ